MTGMDVLRERIARALWEEGMLEPDDTPRHADAVIAALGLVEGIVSFDGERQRCWTTPWERIGDDA